MSQSRSLVIGVVFLFMMVGLAAASSTDIYIAQNAAGANTGADCANAHSASWFNTSSNWGSAANQIGPGTTAHLCGTWNGNAGQQFLTAQASGTTSNPITILFESGTILQAPYFSANGAIVVAGVNNIVIDGGGNGVVQNTLNGTSGASCIGGPCSYQQSSLGVGVTNCANCVVRNLIVRNLYLHSSLSDTGDHAVFSIYGNADNGFTVQNNTVSDGRWCIFYAYGANDTNLTYDGNTTYHCDHNLTIGNANSNSSLNGVIVSNNISHDMSNWDDNSNSSHHSCMHFWAVAQGAKITGTYQVSRNYCYGDFGNHATAGFFFEANSGGSQTGLEIFNNLIDHTSTQNAAPNGLLYTQVGNCSIYNNSFRDAGGTGSKGWNGIDFAGSGCTLKNNIFTGMNVYLYVESGVSLTADANLYFNSTSGWDYHGSFTNSFTSWKSLCNCDSAGNTNDPKLASDMTLQSGSGAIQSASNLTGLLMTSLDVDKANVNRPTGSSPWDTGAYQFTGSGGPPQAPTGLAAAVH